MRTPSDEYETDSEDDFSDREDKDIAPITVSRSGRPIRAQFPPGFLRYMYAYRVDILTFQKLTEK